VYYDLRLDKWIVASSSSSSGRVLLRYYHNLFTFFGIPYQQIPQLYII
jgi:hypothetical protein